MGRTLEIYTQQITNTNNPGTIQELRGTIPTTVGNSHINFDSLNTYLQIASVSRRLVQGTPMDTKLSMLKSVTQNGLERCVLSAIHIHRFPTTDQKYCFQPVDG